MWGNNGCIIAPEPHGENPRKVNYTDPWGGCCMRGGRRPMYYNSHTFWHMWHSWWRGARRGWTAQAGFANTSCTGTGISRYIYCRRYQHHYHGSLTVEYICQLPGWRITKRQPDATKKKRCGCNGGVWILTIGTRRWVSIWDRGRWTGGRDITVEVYGNTLGPIRLILTVNYLVH